MFGWLQIRKLKAAISSVKPRAANSEPPQKGPPGNGANVLGIDSDTLKPHPLLALLPAGTLDRLIAESAIAEYPKGTVIYREGEPSDAIFLIISGRCEVRRHEPDGEARGDRK